MAVCALNLKMLRNSNYMLLAQEVGAQCLKIQRRAKEHDQNVSGMFLS